MRVLFVTNTSRTERPYLDPAARYRCYNPAYDFRAQGVNADVVSLKYFSASMIPNYDAFVFHKPPFSRDLEAAIALIEKQNKWVGADYDDLIFDEKNALESSLFLSGRASEKAVIDIFRRNHSSLNYFRNVSVSTSRLADQVRLSNASAEVAVVHNGLNSEWIEISKGRFRETLKIEHEIAYFSGTKSHNHDFLTIEDTLSKILYKHRKSTLKIVGPLDFNINKFPKRRVRAIKAVSYEDLPPLIKQATISIAPLKDNLFNSCKSGLKYFEAAVFQTATIATPIPDMLRFSNSGILLPEKELEWMESFETLLDNEESKALAKKSYDFAISNCLSSLQTKKLHNFISGRESNSRKTNLIKFNQSLA